MGLTGSFGEKDPPCQLLTAWQGSCTPHTLQHMKSVWPCIVGVLIGLELRTWCHCDFPYPCHSQEGGWRPCLSPVVHLPGVPCSELFCKNLIVDLYSVDMSPSTLITSSLVLFVIFTHMQQSFFVLTANSLQRLVASAFVIIFCFLWGWRRWAPGFWGQYSLNSACKLDNTCYDSERVVSMSPLG